MPPNSPNSDPHHPHHPHHEDAHAGHDHDSHAGHVHGKARRGGHSHGGHSHGDHGHHGHGHAGHSHVPADTNEGRLAAALVVIALFMLIEIAGGVISGSLALIADAAHMASDAVALGMSWAAMRIGKRPATRTLSYGYRRLEVLVAFVNGLTLMVISVGVTIEAIRRFAEPQPVLGTTMLWVAIAGLLSNVVAFFILHGGNRENLNMRSAWLHVLGDMVSSVAAIIAAVVILLTNYSPIDPILSILVSILIVRSAWSVTRSAAAILLEATPPGIDPDAIRTELVANVPGLADVHHVHVWCLTSESVMVTLHARGTPDGDPLQLPAAINAALRERFGIEHATVQVEAELCADPVCRTDEAGGTGHGGDHGHAHSRDDGHGDHDHSHHDHGHSHAPGTGLSVT